LSLESSSEGAKDGEISDEKYCSIGKVLEPAKQPDEAGLQQAQQGLPCRKRAGAFIVEVTKNPAESELA
jgi:hypothetical protein